jgi:hypothetical protein
MLFLSIVLIALISTQRLSLISCSDAESLDSKDKEMSDPSKRQQIPNRFCRSGQLDSGVRTKDGHIFIFFDNYLLELDERQMTVSANPIPINDYFQGLNFERIDAAFTADGYNNPKKGYTYFIRGSEIREYMNERPTGGSANWTKWLTRLHLKSTHLVINQIGDSIAVFFDIDPQRASYQSEAYNLDSVTDPTLITSYIQLIDNQLISDPLNRGYILKAVISLSNSYLVFYDSSDPRNEGKYCKTNVLSDGVSYRINVCL